MIKSKLFKDIIVELKNIIILVAVPILLSSIFDMLFNKVYVEQIPFGIVDMDNSSTSRSIIQQFQDHPGFKIISYDDSYDELKGQIKTKKVAAGLIIPENFGKDASNMKAPKTMLLIDGTNIVVGNNALSYGSAILNTVNAKIQLSVLEGNNMLPYLAQQSISSLSFTERVLYDPQMSYRNYLLYGLIVVLTQQTYLAFLSGDLIERKLNMIKIKMCSKKGFRNILLLFLRIFSAILLSCIGSAGSLYCAGKYFNLPLQGSIVSYFIIFSIFIINITGIAFILACIFDSVENCTKMCMMLSIPTFITATYVWPEYMMPNGLADIIKKIWPLIYVANPLRMLSLKGSDFSSIFPYIKGGIHYTLFYLPVSIGLYSLRIIIAKYKKNIIFSENS